MDENENECLLYITVGQYWPWDPNQYNTHYLNNNSNTIRTKIDPSGVCVLPLGCRH